MKKAIIYCRTSGDDTERDSLSAQERLCREYATGKYEVIAVLKESVRGISGASFNVPQLKKALELAIRKTYDVLIIRDISRFSRDIEKFAYFEPRLKKYVDIEFCWNNFDDTPAGKFYKTLTVGLAELEKEMIALRMQAGKRDKVKERQSMIIADNELFGFNVQKINGQFKAIVNETEAVIIRKIFDLYVNEGLSTYALADRLEEDRVPTYGDLRGKTPRGKKRGRYQWSISTIRQILRNTAYKGEWRYGKERRVKETVVNPDGSFDEVYKRKFHDKSNHIVVKVAPIVSEELWNAAQRKLVENRTNKGRKPTYKYLMYRRVLCKCGRTLHTGRKLNKYTRKNGDRVEREYFYYVCRATERGFAGGKCCDVKRTDATVLDEVVWNWLKSILTDTDELNARIENYHKEIAKQLEPLELSLSITKSELEPTKEQYARLIHTWSQADEYDRAFLEEDKKILRTKLEVLQKQYDQLKEEIDSLRGTVEGVKNFIDHYHRADEIEAEIAAEVEAEMRAKREEMSDEEKAFLDMPLDFSDVDTSGIEPRSTKDRFLDINANIQETLKESGYYDMPENKDKWHASVNLSELATLLRGELTFEQKQKLIKQFNVTAHLSENQEYITAKCTLGEQFLSLYAATKYGRNQLQQKFSLDFSDVLKLQLPVDKLNIVV